MVDRPIQVEGILAQTQLMAAQMASLKMLNEVFQELELPVQSSLHAAVTRAELEGIMSRREAQNMFDLNRRANQAKHNP